MRRLPVPEGRRHLKSTAAVAASLAMLIVLLVALPAVAYSPAFHGVFYSGGSQPMKPPTWPTPAPTPPAPPPPNPPPAPTSLTSEEARVFELINQARADAGLPPLKLNYTLVGLARLKAQDMVANRYFAHYSPTYGHAEDMVRAAGLRFSYVRENLAGAANVEVAHQALMNSPGHRPHILSTIMDEVGVAVVHGGIYRTIVVQIFLAH